MKSLHIEFKICEFKKLNPEHPIGLTRFSELRPKYCVLAGARGTHSVCVCTDHQNFKAMLDAIDIKRLTNNLKNPVNNFKDCFPFVVCKTPTPACYLRDCESCPDIGRFSDYITKLLQQRGVSEIIFSTWQSTDRCTLIKECLSTDDFVSQLCTRLEKLL